MNLSLNSPLASNLRARVPLDGQTRYLVKYRHVDAKLVLKVTDDVVVWPRTAPRSTFLSPQQPHSSSLVTSARASVLRWMELILEMREVACATAWSDRGGRAEPGLGRDAVWAVAVWIRGHRRT